MSTRAAPVASRDGTSAFTRIARLASGRQWAAIAAGWMLYSLVNVILFEITPSMDSMRVSGFAKTVVALSVAIFWTLATPFVFALAVRVRADRVGLPRMLAAHSIACLLAAVGVIVTQRATLQLLYPDKTIHYVLPFILLLDYNIITYTMLAMFGSALDRHREYTASRTRNLTLLTQLSEARLQFLQRQLQPHFLFNALNTVAELARESPVVARRTLLNLSRLLHSSMAHADDPEVTLREELTTLEPFIQIQRLRFSDSLDIGIDVAPGALVARVPPLLLQPLIENAIRHGRAGRGERGKVTIVARQSGDRLILRVEDDGARFSAAHPVSTGSTHAGHGIGLRNTTERLTQLYGTNYRFALRLENDGTTIAELDLPFRDSADAAPATREHADDGDDAMALNDRRSNEHLVYAGDELVAIVGLSERSAAPFDYADTPTDSDTTGAPQLSPRAWALILAFWGFAALFWTTQVYTWRRVFGMQTPFTIVSPDLISSLVWAGYTPIVLWLARTIRIQRGGVRAAIAFHVVAAAALSALHIAIVYSIGVEDRPLLVTNNIDPFILNFFIYFVLVAWSHARDFTVWYQARSMSAARTLAGIARARVDATAIALHTPFLLHTLDSAASLALTSATRTERVVERLADLLRAVLQTAGQGTHTVRDELLLLERCLDVQSELSGVRTGVTSSIDEGTLTASLPPGVGTAVMEHVLTHARTAPDVPLHVEVRPAGPGRWREIVFRVAPCDPVVPPSLTASQAG